ncbi:hypothetical protein TVAG_338590 [Trichomonas vaginalis G3]|uniref:receptor protein-tyrosine kinase n=1 Tax=Trichomonas vaginalis (strain ATCC PRA-98 / G3) TaxID=412133 RepID=A2FPB2_TRIV3|nr:metallopeptidase protein [Trichomonas vaginalis G3]EAX93260.1 hypothetical protein TVAG_338590 [Trichomonas vaginalis G3]KAI5496362.1 metallopeptidase protein [Trichomonas vaginalis G3]|eukprot:XP_001306190.1 hypothetical protein [Trichomonas vaginalis G3]
MSVQGIQEWTVPVTGLYRIRAAGAAGGMYTYSNTRGGYGAIVESEFNLSKSGVIKILVGQKGEDTRKRVAKAAPGGGGGTFVFENTSVSNPMIAAGGSGGGSPSSSSNKDASFTENGQNSGTGDLGGTNGNGGGINKGNYDYWAGGGAGWLTDGTGGNNPTLHSFSPGSAGAQGGRSQKNGGIGGTRYNDGNDEGGDGGFGGGGGGGSANMGTGGGGGYSGGAGAKRDSSDNVYSGGGGGSFSRNKKTYLSVSNDGHGYVNITLLNVIKTVNCNTCNYVFQSSLLNLINSYLFVILSN